MSIKIDLTTPDVDKQISVLKEFPNLAEKHYRPALRRDVALLKALIVPNIPVRTGAAAAAFGTRVGGRGFNMRGLAGWYDRNDPWYINVVEHGAASHDITVAPVKKSVLAFNGADGMPAFSAGHTISHPGFGARGFMAEANKSIGPTVDADLAQANERIIADLAAI